ncbi:pantothenic acid transporter PanT [Oxobacter pfennigii]|uniref:Pantothenic acid transporter PanT n=1 Tax=Oxobacter pfennigii TaxID=36849 RepID=A0A0P8WKB3_9CLOT|nr:ECF transporter S component [Oxobacter pfennigii]KPU42723.1 pantothenic acid transporter PanT [Oxobacter pfennigii]
MKNAVNATSQSSFNTRKLTTIALLGAIAAVMSLTPFGFIQVGVIRITFMHIPVIVAAILEGPLAGAAVGLIFGVASLVSNLSTPLAPVFLNPMVSIVPRILIGVLSAYIYRASKSSILAAVVGTATNTVGVLGMIYLVAAQQFANIRGITMDNLGKVLLGVAATNGLAEIAVAVVLIAAIVKALNRTRK